MDPEILRLWRRYVGALKAYDNALQKRRQLRTSALQESSPPKASRSPAGSGQGPRVPQSSPSVKGLVFRAGPPKIYLESLWDFAKVLDFLPTGGEKADSSTRSGDDAPFDKVRLQLCWNAKSYYEKCRREFFDYAGQKRDSRGVEATSVSGKPFKRDLSPPGHEAHLHLPWSSEASEKALRNYAMEVEIACCNAWENYRDRRDDPARRKELVATAVEAQLAPGLDSSPIVRTILSELERLKKPAKRQ